MKRFTKGDVVHHDAYGEGEVLGADYAKKLVAVEFDTMRVVHPSSLTMDPDRDIEEAKALLEKHGYAFRIYGPMEVHRVLDSYAEGDDGLDTVTYRDEITRHVMEGDDWPSMSDTTELAEDAHDLLWSIIAGTHHDHPEWFPVTKSSS